MSLWFIRLVSLYSAIPPVCLMVCRGDIFIDNSNQVLTHISYCDILYVERLFILRGDIPMYIRKEEKINIIKWFIRKWSCGGSDLDLEHQWKETQKRGFSYEDFQMLWIIRSAYGLAKQEKQQANAATEIKDYERTIHNPAWGELFTQDSLLAYFQQHYHKDFNTTNFIELYQNLMNRYPQKWVRKTPFYQIMHLNPDIRSVFMLENIAAALNEYNVVFSEMGASHFIEISKALKKMMGKPLYIQADQIPAQQIWQNCTLNGLQEKVLVAD